MAPWFYGSSESNPDTARSGSGCLCPVQADLSEPGKTHFSKRGALSHGLGQCLSEAAGIYVHSGGSAIPANNPIYHDALSRFKCIAHPSPVSFVLLLNPNDRSDHDHLPPNQPKPKHFNERNSFSRSSSLYPPPRCPTQSVPTCPTPATSSAGPSRSPPRDLRPATAGPASLTSTRISGTRPLASPSTSTLRCCTLSGSYGGALHGAMAQGADS